MAFPTYTELDYDYVVGTYEVEISASESYWYGPGLLVVSIHSDSIPFTFYHTSTWNGMPMSLARSNEVLQDAGVTVEVRTQVANRLLMDYTRSWFDSDADLVEYGLCPNITINVHFYDDSSSDSSYESDINDDIHMEVDQADHPAPPEPMDVDGLREIYHLDLDDDECTICLLPMLESDPVLQTPCQHHFHPNCLRSWLLVQNNCPLCRAEF